MGKCRECGRDVAKSAPTCPGCGVRGPVKHTPLSAWIGLGVVVLVVGKMCGNLADRPSPNSTATGPSPAIAAAALAPAQNQKPAPQPAAKPPEKLPPLAAATLLQAYKANEVKADIKYKGKRFKVTGTVVGIRSDFTNDPQVELVTDLLGVTASGLSKEFAATLNKGDTLEADCTVTGSVMSSPMLDCSK